MKTATQNRRNMAKIRSELTGTRIRHFPAKNYWQLPVLSAG